MHVISENFTAIARLLLTPFPLPLPYSALLSALGAFLINSQRDLGVISCPGCLDRTAAEAAAAAAAARAHRPGGGGEFTRV